MSRASARLPAALAFVATLGGASSGGVAADAQADLVSRGEYLVRAGDCTACHTADPSAPFAGGNQIDTPFGSISTPNITPDRDTGIGDWTDDAFYRAMHEGLDADGTNLYPVFPFPWYTRVTRDDVLAIKAYLFSLKPVHAPRKPSHLRFPYNIRTALDVWRTLNFTPGTFQPDPNASAQINRGAYLVEGLGHCGECHTPRTALGAAEREHSLAGAEAQGWFSPNISSDMRAGIGGWSEDELVSYLRTGATPTRSVAAGPMRQVVDESLRYLTDEDLHAIAAYLKVTPARPQPEAGSTPPTRTGADLYLNNCGYCHRPDGTGVTGQIPPLAGNGAVRAAGPEDVIRVVLAGLAATGTYAPMPAQGADLTDAAIAAITNYVRTAWGNNAPPNAEIGRVAALRRDSAIPLTGTPPHCPDIAPPAVAQAISGSSELATLLRDTTEINAAQQATRAVELLRGAAPQASQAELVNGLSAAYCHTLAANPDAAARSRLTWFGQAVYGAASDRPLEVQPKPPASQGASASAKPQ